MQDTFYTHIRRRLSFNRAEEFHGTLCQKYRIVRILQRPYGGTGAYVWEVSN